MEKITRTLTTTTINYSEAVNENGSVVVKTCKPEVVPGEISDNAKATQYLRKKYGADRAFVVNNMTTARMKYEMDLADFVAMATATPIQDKSDAPDAAPMQAETPDDDTSPAAPIEPERGGGIVDEDAAPSGGIDAAPPAEEFVPQAASIGFAPGFQSGLF